MEIQSIQLDLQEIAADFHPPTDRDESKVHVTDLRDALLETLGLQKREEKLPQWVKNLGSFGTIWEKVIYSQIRSQVWSDAPPERHFQGALTLETDDVIGSLDGLITERYRGGKPLAVWENKTRWKAVELPTDNDKYMIQAKAYCWMAGCSQCWFSVLNISARPPNMVQWLHVIDFTAMELMENWQSLMHMKPMVERQKYGS